MNVAGTPGGALYAGGYRADPIALAHPRRSAGRGTPWRHRATASAWSRRAAISLARMLPIVLLPVLALAPPPAGGAPPCRLQPGIDDQHAGNAGCLVRVGDRMLVLRHRWGGYLGLPGGRSDPGETARCTAHRETWEETGLDVEVGQLLMGFVNGFSVFACRTAEPLPADAELELPDHATNEVRALMLSNPDDISAEDWRFPSQWGPIRAIFLLVPDSAAAPNPAMQ
jgi:8-oxo-dGTP pyrophosphatase MutT (NUDIX family)